MELERRSAVGGRIDKTCLKVLTKELSTLSISPQYGALFNDFRFKNGLYVSHRVSRLFIVISETNGL